MTRVLNSPNMDDIRNTMYKRQYEEYSRVVAESDASKTFFIRIYSMSPIVHEPIAWGFIYGRANDLRA